MTTDTIPEAIKLRAIRELMPMGYYRYTCAFCGHLVTEHYDREKQLLTLKHLETGDGISGTEVNCHFAGKHFQLPAGEVVELQEHKL